MERVTTLPMSTINCQEGNFIFCYHFQENDYKQVFVIALLMLLIHLGLTLIQYPVIQTFIQSLQKAREEGGTTGLKTMFANDEEDKYQVLFEDSHSFGGWDINGYIIYSAINTALYFAIKILLIKDSSISDANSEYKHDSFHAWVNAKTIIVTCIFIHSSANAKEMLDLAASAIKAKLLYPISYVFLLVFVVDSIASIVFICIKYGYLVFILYLSAVSLLIACTMMVAFICVIPIMFLYFWVIIRFFQILACGADEQKPFGKFMSNLGGGIAWIGFAYLIACLMLVFVFLLVGGPTEAVLGLDRNNHRHMTMAYLFLAATIIGVLVMISGMFRVACCEAGRTRIPTRET